MNTLKLAFPLLLALSGGAAQAHVMPFLGAAQQFVILGAGSVTNAEASTLHGDLGIASNSSITGTSSIGFASGGVIHQGDAAARQAQSDAQAAYGRLAAFSGGVDLSGQDLGSIGTLSSGIYRFATSAALTGALTIDFANDPSGVVIFQIGSTLTTASRSIVNVINGTSSNGIYFQVGSSATLGARSAFAGNILAQHSVSFGAAASLGCGRVLATTVTLIGNRVSNDCNAWSPAGMAGDYGSGGYSGFGVTALPPAEVPEPATLALFGLGLCAAALVRPRRPQTVTRAALFF